MTLTSHGVPVSFCLQDIGELHGLREVFVQGDYEVSLPRAPEVILDLGGNIGAASVYFATRWPHAQVIVLEPDPDAYKRLARNTSPFARVRALQMAATGEGGEATLYRTGHTLTSSLLPESGGEGSLPVQAASLDWILDGPCGGSVDLVKFDIEGSEYAVMLSSDRRAKIPILVGELHEDLMGCSLDAFADLFPDHTVEIEALPNGEHAFRGWLKQFQNVPKR